MAKNAPKNGHNPSNIGNGSNGHGKNGNAVRIPHFASKLITSVPHGRKGKHNLIVSMILDDLDRLELENAVLVPLDSLEGEKMENVRSALNRATRQRNMLVTTATDEKYFYVWRTELKNSQSAAAPHKPA